MNIAIVCPYALDRPGGVQNQALAHARWLREAGHEAYVVAPTASGGGEGVVPVGRAIEIPINRSSAPVRLTPGTTRRVIRALAEADVVHIHEPLVPAVSLGAMLRASKPLVGTFHADPSATVRRLYRLAAPALRSLVKRLNVITAVSRIAAEAISPFAYGVELIPNAIDVESYRDKATQPDPHQVVFLGRDEPRKGLDVLLQAWPAVVKRVPTARLVVAGAVRDEPLPGVTYLGPVDEADKRKALNGSAVAVAPNLGGESFGIVLVEAMAAGCAVIASRLPAFEAVAGEAASYVDPGDVDDLARALIVLLDDPDLVRARQRDGTRRAEHYDGSRVIDDYLKLYTRAVEAGSR